MGAIDGRETVQVDPAWKGIATTGRPSVTGADSGLLKGSRMIHCRSSSEGLEGERPDGHYLERRYEDTTLNYHIERRPAGLPRPASLSESAHPG